MLQPKRTKFRKTHRGNMRGLAQRGNYVAFGDYGLKSLSASWVTSRQIEAARRAIVRHLRRGGKLWIRIFPAKPITKKPLETRQGGGKGPVDAWVAVVRPGRIMFEIGGVSAEDGSLADERHSSSGQGVARAWLAHEERRAGVTAEISGVLCEFADEEDGISRVEREGHKRAVWMPGQVARDGAQRPCPFLTGERQRTLCVAGSRDLRIVEELLMGRAFRCGSVSVSVILHGVSSESMLAFSRPEVKGSGSRNRAVRSCPEIHGAIVSAFSRLWATTTRVHRRPFWGAIRPRS